MNEKIIVLQSALTDSIMLNSLNHKISSIQGLVNKQTYNSWIPFISAVTGGILVLAGQSIDRFFKSRTEIKNNLREIYSYSRKLEALMKNNYRELALAKVHVEYWWYCSETSLGENKIKYYEEHLKSQGFAREVERRIGEFTAEFIGHVRKFQAIKALKPEIEIQLLAISNLKNAKAKLYGTELNHEEVRYKKVEEDENSLRETYYKNLDHFKSITDYLQGLI